MLREAGDNVRRALNDHGVCAYSVRPASVLFGPLVSFAQVRTDKVRPSSRSNPSKDTLQSGRVFLRFRNTDRSAYLYDNCSRVKVKDAEPAGYCVPLILEHQLGRSRTPSGFPGLSQLGGS